MIFTRFLLLIGMLGCFNLSNGHVFILETNLPKKELEFLFSNLGANQDPNSLLNFQAQFSTWQTKLPEGITVTINYQPEETEFIICERNRKLSNISEAARVFLQQDLYVNRFVEKGFLFLTKKERCKGYLYSSLQDSQEIPLIGDFIQKAIVEQFPFVIEKEKRDASDQSSVNIVIKSKGALQIVFFYNDIKAKHFSKKIQWKELQESFGPGSVRETYKAKYKGNELVVYIGSNSRVDSRLLEINAVSTLEGSGLHQKLVRELLVDSKTGAQKQFSTKEDCSVVLLDFLSEQTYVDQDEIRNTNYMELKRFEVLDIEKPTEAAKQYVWLIKMKLSELKALNGDNGRLSISYPVHFRYQRPREESYANSTLFLKTKFFTDCKFNDLPKKDEFNPEGFYEQKMKELYNATYTEISMNHFQSQNDFNDRKVSDNIIIQVPVGEIALESLVTLVTLIVSVGGAAAILYFILQTKKPHLE